MGNTTLIYKEKFEKSLNESKKHILRIETAFNELLKSYSFPMSENDFHNLLENNTHLAFVDQIIYRFSKAQDSMGAKLFKSYLLFQGENVDRPFMDILATLEKINMINVDEWFELREIRNEISHDYEDSEARGRDIINSIYNHKNDLKNITNLFEKSENN
jgi:hypothetical protein